MAFRIGQVNHIGSGVHPNYDMTRMYPLGRQITWRGVIHEQVVRDGDDPRLQRMAVRIRVDHWGYDPQTMQARRKLDRNIALLYRWTAQEPQNPAAWGFLGRDLFVAGRYEECIGVLYKAETLGMQDATYARLPEVRGVLCDALVRAQRLDEARTVAERFVQSNPEHPNGWFWMAQITLLQADQMVQKVLQLTRKGRETAPVYRGVVAFTPQVMDFSLTVAEADAWKMLGQWGRAWQLYDRALQLNPGHAGVQAQKAHLLREAQTVIAASQDKPSGPPQLQVTVETQG